jgi:cold shock protein
MPMPKFPLVRATVRWFSDEEGWGVADAPEAPGGIFVHFSAIQADGYRTLHEGQALDVRLEGPLDFDQDGCRYRAVSCRPLA